MGRHAADPVSWLDIAAALWTPALSWLSAWTQAVGRHEPADDRTPAAVLIAQPARFSWPGAEPDWADQVRAWNDEDIVVRPEVRA